MSFTARTLGRATGTSGRIQPRISPITAPDPWQGPSTLEFEDLEVEARPPDPAPRRERERERERVSPKMDPAPPRREREAAPRTAAAAVPPRPSRSAELEVPAVPREPSRERVGPPSTIELETREEIEVPVPPATRAPLEAPASTEAPARVDEPGQVREAVPSFRAQRRLDRASPAMSSPSRSPLASLRLDEVDVEVEIDSPAPTLEMPPSSRPLPPAEARQAAAREARARSATPAARRSEARSLEGTPTRAPDPGDPTAPFEAWASADPPPSPRLRRRGSESSGPTVRVEIGRVELKSPTKPETPAPTGIPKPEGFVSLKQYLRERGNS